MWIIKRYFLSLLVIFLLLFSGPQLVSTQQQEDTKIDLVKAKQTLLRLEQTNEELGSLLIASRKETSILNKNLADQLVQQENLQSKINSLKIQLDEALLQAELSTIDSEKLKTKLNEIESSLKDLEKNLDSIKKQLNRAILLNKILGFTTIVSSAGLLTTLLIILL